MNCTKSTQFAPKFTCLRCNWWGWGHPLPTPQPLGAFGASIFAPSALKLGVPRILFLGNDALGRRRGNDFSVGGAKILVKTIKTIKFTI